MLYYGYLIDLEAMKWGIPDNSSVSVWSPLLSLSELSLYKHYLIHLKNHLYIIKRDFLINRIFFLLIWWVLTSTLESLLWFLAELAIVFNKIIVKFRTCFCTQLNYFSLFQLTPHWTNNFYHFMFLSLPSSTVWHIPVEKDRDLALKSTMLNTVFPKNTRLA